MFFPEPRHVCISDSVRVFRELSVCGPCSDLFIEAARICGKKAVLRENAKIRLQLVSKDFRDEDTGNEAYLIQVPEENDSPVLLQGGSEEALARGIWTLLEMISLERDQESERPASGSAAWQAKEGLYSIPCGRIADAAEKQFRGVHLYLPPEDGIEECKRFLAIIAKLRYNAIILEIGGGMAYHRHPEINRAWTKFCREAYQHTHGPQGLQASEAYWKDSTHVELAGGGVLPQEAVRELADYARLLRLEVIPEIQGLSHAYYLTMADRSIAERPFERWPDSYCPSNPRSYELYEDCAEEIVKVIRPKRVSIGHDEVRILGECPLCRKKSGAELLAGDINRLYDFYAARGIRIMMWGEKLQNFENFKGIRTGGVEIPLTIDRYGRRYRMPATFEAIDRIPRDILMLDWYYSQGGNTEEGFAEKGFCEIFGNFAGSKIADWARRGKAENVIGAEVSTWCVPEEKELGENGWFYELAFSAAVLWQPGYNDEQRGIYHQKAEAVQNELRGLMREHTERFDGTLLSLEKLSLPDRAAEEMVQLKAAPDLSGGLCKLLSQNGLQTADVFETASKADSLVFFHAAQNPGNRRIQTWFFLDPEPQIPASYAVDYADGLTIRIPVRFPNQTGVFESDGSYFRPVGEQLVSADVDDERKAVVSRPAPMAAPTDPWRAAAVYFCRNAVFETNEGSRTVYAWEWKNPRPDEVIERVRLVPEEKSPMDLKCFGVGVCLAKE